MYHQVVLTFNPWSDRHWLKKRFFDEPSENVLAMTTNYLCNEFLSESDLVLFEEMKKNPKR
ncbi:MAG: phage terminase large subunit [Veillonella parvula]